MLGPSCAENASRESLAMCNSNVLPAGSYSALPDSALLLFVLRDSKQVILNCMLTIT